MCVTVPNRSAWLSPGHAAGGAGHDAVVGIAPLEPTVAVHTGIPRTVGEALVSARLTHAQLQYRDTAHPVADRDRPTRPDDPAVSSIDYRGERGAGEAKESDRLLIGCIEHLCRIRVLRQVQRARARSGCHHEAVETSVIAQTSDAGADRVDIRAINQGAIRRRTRSRNHDCTLTAQPRHHSAFHPCRARRLPESRAVQARDPYRQVVLYRSQVLMSGELPLPIPTWYPRTPTC